MYGCESWTKKKIEHQRTDAFKLWCWRRLLRVAWTARKSVNLKGNQPWILIGRTDAGSSCIFVTWCEQPTHWKSPQCWERLSAEEESVRGWDGWMASPMQWTWTWANFGRWWGTERPGILQSMRLQRVGHDWATEQQQSHFLKISLPFFFLPATILDNQMTLRIKIERTWVIVLVH